MRTDPWKRLRIGFVLWAVALAAIAVLLLLLPSRATSAPDVTVMCKQFADNTVKLSPIKKDVPDEDAAHSLVATAVPQELWPTWHWMIRLIYREPAEKLQAAAMRDCLRHHGKSAGFTVVLGIRG